MITSGNSNLIDIDFAKYPFVHNGEALVVLTRKHHRDGLVYNVKNCPLDYVPLILYVGHQVESCDPVRVDGVINLFEVDEVLRLCEKAKNEGKMRDLVEVFASVSPRVADILYRIDHLGLTEDKFTAMGDGKKKTIFLSSWASYGRRYLDDLCTEMASFRSDKESCLLLPCSGHRPYNEAKSYQAIRNRVEDIDSYHKVVISSLGVIPEEYWNNSIVLKYDSGVPDIWRLYELCKKYFALNQYKSYRNFVEFAPFLDIIELCGITTRSEMKPRKFVA